MVGATVKVKGAYVNTSITTRVFVATEIVVTQAVPPVTTTG